MSERLDRASLAEVAQNVSPGSRTLRVRSLGGGLSALTHAIDIETRPGHRIRLVVRSTEAPDSRGPDLGERQFRLIGRLFESGLPVPEPLWFGVVRGRPTLVTAWVPGRPLL